MCVTFADVAVSVKLYVPGGVGTPPPPPPPFDPPPPQAASVSRIPTTHNIAMRAIRLPRFGRMNTRAAATVAAHGHIGALCWSDALAAVVVTETTMWAVLTGSVTELGFALQVAPAGAPLQLNEMVPPALKNRKLPAKTS